VTVVAVWRCAHRQARRDAGCVVEGRLGASLPQASALGPLRSQAQAPHQRHVRTLRLSPYNAPRLCALAPFPTAGDPRPDALPAPRTITPRVTASAEDREYRSELSKPVPP